jgi:hypothetical protein
MAKEKYYQLSGVLPYGTITYKSSPVTDDAFPSRLTSLSKQRESIIRHRASYHMAIINTKAAR